MDTAGRGTDLNQAWLRYANEDYGSAKVGRQIYTLDDERFIGAVGWRQNIQTFDAATVDFTGVDKLSLKAFYFVAQNAVNGAHNDLDSFGANASYALADPIQLTGFYYYIDGTDTGNAAQSSATIGVRANGDFPIVDQKFAYFASYAYQEDAGSSPQSYSASYLTGDLSTAVAKVTLGGGFEYFEPGFSTPLATVHKFNGYADAYLPITGFTNGLKDFYAYVGYTIPLGNGIKTKVIYHYFEPENSGAPGQDGGQEIDLVGSYAINDYLSLVAKYGNYNSDGGVGAGGLQGALDKEMFTFEFNFIY